MKTWKIISGILSITIGAFVVFQSFFAGAYNILTGNGQSSGTAGVVVAITLLAGGIVSLVTHNGSRGGDIAMALLYCVGGIVGLVMAGSYGDLRVWSAWSLLCGLIAIVDVTRMERGEKKVSATPIPQTTATSTRRGPATFQEVILEPDPIRRNAAIDALPERQAKSYLKQALNVLVPRQLRGEDEDEESGLIKVLLGFLAVIGVGVIAIIAVGIAMGPGKDRSAVGSASPKVSQRVQESAPVQETPGQEVSTQPDVVPGGAIGDLGDYHVEIQGAFIANDYEGKAAIIVTYSWANNSDRTTSAMVAFSEKAFQNGVELDRAVVYSSETPGYESGTSARELRPGASTEVQCVFSLRDDSSIVEFEISELISFSDDVVSVNFDPAGLNVVG